MEKILQNDQVMGLRLTRIQALNVFYDKNKIGQYFCGMV